jgi:aspartate kinase
LALTNGGTGIDDTDRDDIIAMGERTSARLFAASLKSHGIQARYFEPSDRDWPIITDNNFQNANPVITRSIERIQRYVKPIIEHGMIPVIGGFIGRTRDGRISTLGRGGSDTTALLLATALEADEIVLVTNVAGVLTGDPALVGSTRLIPEIDMKALLGIADAGTKFIRRKALKFKDPNINIRVIGNNTGRLDTQGTIITGSPLSELDVTLQNPHAIASLTIIGRNISGTSELVKKATRAARSNLVAVSQHSNSAIFYLKQTPALNGLISKLHDVVVKNPSGIGVAARKGLALVTVKGVGLEDTPGVIAKISEALHAKLINIFGILTITSSVLVLVDWKARKQAANLIRGSLEN